MLNVKRKMASSANCEYLLSCVWLQSVPVTTFPIVTPRTQRQSTTTLQFYQSDDDVVYIANIAPGCGEKRSPLLSLGPNGSLFRGSNYNHHHLLLVGDKKCTAPLHWLVGWSQEIWFIFHLQWLQWCTLQLKITSEKTLISNFAQ